jgi:hypothetical protein
MLPGSLNVACPQCGPRAKPLNTPPERQLIDKNILPSRPSSAPLLPTYAQKVRPHHLQLELRSLKSRLQSLPLTQQSPGLAHPHHNIRNHPATTTRNHG